jgi:hypothetical protein
LFSNSTVRLLESTASNGSHISNIVQAPPPVRH